MYHIRPAQEADLSGITEIYNDAILTTTATFDTEVKTLENRLQWFKERDENFPVLVVEQDHQIIAYAALNKWSERKAYDITAEISLYVHKVHRGKGIGKTLISKIVTAAKEKGSLNSLIARITEGNDQSIYLHQQNGFTLMGIMKQAGMKFGKLHDVTFMQLMLK